MKVTAEQQNTIKSLRDLADKMEKHPSLIPRHGFSYHIFPKTVEEAVAAIDAMDKVTNTHDEFLRCYAVGVEITVGLPDAAYDVPPARELNIASTLIQAIDRANVRNAQAKAIYDAEEALGRPHEVSRA